MHPSSWPRIYLTCLPLLVFGSACKRSDTGGRSGLASAQSPGNNALVTDLNARITPRSIYRPEAASTYKYNHAAMITPFQGDLYVMWSAGLKDEDVDVDVVYAVSKDQGATWGSTASRSSF